MQIWKDVSWEAAHRLPRVPLNHQCARLHGHSFKARILVEGSVDPRQGWVVDFAEIKKAWKPLHALLDHRYLNEVPGLHNPTSENIARWIGERLSEPLGSLLHSVTVQETCSSGAIWCNRLHAVLEGEHSDEAGPSNPGGREGKAL